LRLFRTRDRSDCNLFSACCQYCEPEARLPGFGWPELLLFYAGFMERWYRAGDTARRLTSQLIGAWHAGPERRLAG
jgi:hypothetical protein